MKSLIRTLGIFVVALSLGIFLGPRVESMVQLTAAAVQGQVQSGSAQLQSSLDAAAPGVASHLATLLIVLGAIMLSTLISLVIFVPLRIHSMKREIRAQREEIQSMKSDATTGCRSMRRRNPSRCAPVRVCASGWRPGARPSMQRTLRTIKSGGGEPPSMESINRLPSFHSMMMRARRACGVNWLKP